MDNSASPLKSTPGPAAVPPGSAVSVNRYAVALAEETPAYRILSAAPGIADLYPTIMSDVSLHFYLEPHRRTRSPRAATPKIEIDFKSGGLRGLRGASVVVPVESGIWKREHSPVRS